MKLFNFHNDPKYGWACRRSGDYNFLGEIFNNQLDLNDNISGVQVYNNPTCGANEKPEPPILLSPEDGFVSRDGKAPQLCWRAFDPNGDKLKYEVFVSSVGGSLLERAETYDTCWTPLTLSGEAAAYWTVSAHDGVFQGAENPFPRLFSIDLPPTIDFQSANGDPFPSGVIYSNSTNWTFAGTAYDPDDQLQNVNYLCLGDGCGTESTFTIPPAWQQVVNGMTGRNTVYFHAASDDNAALSRPLFLVIDLAKPTTQVNLSDNQGHTDPNQWFTSPVQIRLNAIDQGTLNALSGVKEIHYTIDGVEKTINAAAVTETVSTDGYHTLNYETVDVAGNRETTHSLNFKIDQNPPAWPVAVSETHLTPDGVWQKENNIPTLTWTPPSDGANGSGLKGYQFYFGSDPNGVQVNKEMLAGDTQWNAYSTGVHTGEYFFRGRAQDVAGNWTAWATLYTFRYDSTPPENPASITHTAGITTEWQNQTSQADFSWTPAHDEGAGVQGYSVYWGEDPEGTSGVVQAETTYSAQAPLCAVDAHCTGYLRIRSVDAVGNLAKDWTTAFVLRYDNAPPEVDFLINGGATTTSQIQVMLDVSPQDLGSGVKAVRFSEDNLLWRDWEAPAAQRPWVIQPVGRQKWPVYAQVKDGVGLLSPVVMREIMLDVNVGQPNSPGYRLFDYASSAGSIAYESGTYSGRGTLGQVFNSPTTNSTYYKIYSGYENASQAFPLVFSEHDVYTTLNSAFASGIVFDTTNSPSYRLAISQGGIGLPLNQTRLSSGSYQHDPGFLAAAPSPVEYPEPPDMPPPADDPLITCQSPSISINGDAPFSNAAQVTLSICAPYAVQMKISNYENFSGAGWEEYAATKTWLIPTQGAASIPRYVYAAFREANGREHFLYFDDILYDPQQPTGELLLTDSIQVEAQNSAPLSGPAVAEDFLSRPTAAPASGPIVNPDQSVTLFTEAFDANSGVVEMQLSENADFSGATWQAFAPTVNWSSAEEGEKTVYARFRDSAGNISAASALDFLYDVNPPSGIVYFENPWIPSPVGNVTINLFAQDGAYEYEGELGGPVPYMGTVGEMRVSFEPTFDLAVWMPYTTTLTLPYDFAHRPTVYAQFRDSAGNVSETFSETLNLDTAAPEVYAITNVVNDLTRPVQLMAFDALSGVKTVRLSNDPWVLEDVVTQEYSEKFTWTFDERRVLWVVVEDTAGNRSQPFPVHAVAPAANLFLPWLRR